MLKLKEHSIISIISDDRKILEIAGSNNLDSIQVDNINELASAESLFKDDPDIIISCGSKTIDAIELINIGCIEITCSSFGSEIFNIYSFWLTGKEFKGPEITHRSVDKSVLEQEHVADELYYYVLKETLEKITRQAEYVNSFSLKQEANANIFTKILSVCKNIFLQLYKRNDSCSLVNYFDYYFNILFSRKESVVRKVNNYPMLLNFREPGIAKTLMIYRERENSETNIIKDLIKPGMNVLEIGANIGYYTILMGKLVGRDGRLYAYEPYPFSYNTAKKNIELNNLSDNVELYDLAVSDKNSVQKLYLGNGANLHTLLQNNRNSGYINIKTIDIMDVIKKIGRPINLLRMDIEGHERNIFARFSEENLNILPEYIFFEIHPVGYIDPDPSFMAPLTNLIKLGYKCELAVSSSNPDAKLRFYNLNYIPSKTSHNNSTMVYLFENIRDEDFLKIAARRPKMVRALLLKKSRF